MRIDKKFITELFHDNRSLKSLWTATRLRHVHIAMLFKRGKILEIATNRIGSRVRGCGYDDRTIHAERAVLKKVGDYTKLDGAILIVFRISRGTNELVDSRPCKNCRPHMEKCIKEYGLRCVYHS
jgi:hypothetical protein